MTCSAYLTLAAAAVLSDAPSLAERAREGLLRAVTYWASEVATHGGYLWEYGADLTSRRRGESGDLGKHTVWVQPPGTPSVGRAFLRAYEATGDRRALDAALAAGRCLAWGQLTSGGWDYRIDFDPAENRNRYHHLDPRSTPGYERLNAVSTFDDDVTQSATRFLMELDRFADDPEIDAAIERALRCFLEAQYRGGAWDGAWPQRHPPRKDRYERLPTFNDDAMSDCVRTLLLAHRRYGKPEHLQAVRRALEFYLRSQLPEPQAAWAQQVDEDLKPAWARKFEPPAVCAAESSGNVKLLLEMFLELGDERFLEAAGKAVAWFRRSRIGGNGVWARFYEVGTNRPVYFTRTYELVYTDDDLPVHYSFRGNYGIDDRIREYEEIRRDGREAALARRRAEESLEARRERAQALEGRVRRILAAQDEKGRWVRVVPKKEEMRDAQGRVGYEVDPSAQLSILYSEDFVANVETLAAYLLGR